MVFQDCALDCAPEQFHLQPILIQDLLEERAKKRAKWAKNAHHFLKLSRIAVPSVMKENKYFKYSNFIRAYMIIS